MKFKSNLGEYWKIKGEQLIENITITNEKIEIKGYIKKEPVLLDGNKKERYVYNVHLITENRLLAKEMFFKGDDIWIDGIKFYRGVVNTTTQVVPPANDIDFIWEFQYISYDTFD